MILSRPIRYHLAVSSELANKTTCSFERCTCDKRESSTKRSGTKTTHHIQGTQPSVRVVSLPVARTTGWNFGTSGDRWACRGRRATGVPVCLPPWRGGQRQSPPVRATLWGSARHPPPTPATASTGVLPS